MKATIIESIGFIGLMIGASAMDSDNLIIPVLIAFIGVGLMHIGNLIEERGKHDTLWTDRRTVSSVRIRRRH